MGTVKKVVTSALMITGATALSSIEANAAEQDAVDFLENDRTEIEEELIEKALRNYANPLKRIQAEMSRDRAHTLTYEVKEGDTLSGIAVAHDVKVEQIVSLNHIQNRHKISIGQKLQIPLKERNYIVKHGDTLQGIAAENGLRIEDILSFNLELQIHSHVLPGQELKLPSAPPEPMHQPLRTPKRYVNTKQNHVSIASHSQNGTLNNGSFIWPVKGKISSRFGMRWGRPHNGIDITNTDRSKAAIMASMSGTVTDAYYHRGGYGNLVIIDHGNGLKTYYAHLNRMDVKEGDHVKQGEVIGYMGQTGNATGYHLHFEIRKNNRPVNPIHYLPS